MSKAIVIWERSDTTASPIAVVDDYISYQYQKGFNVTGEFTLILPATVEYLKLVTRSHYREKIVQFDGQFFGLIYKAQISQDSGVKRLVATGRHLTSLLGHYVRGVPGIPGQKLVTHSTDVATDIEYYWIGAQSDDPSRFYNVDPDFWYPVTKEIKFSKTSYVGNWTSTGYFDSPMVNWLEYMESMSQRKDFGFDIKIQDNGYMRLYLLSPVTHDKNEMIISTEFGDVISSVFEESTQQYYTICTSSGETPYEGWMAEVYRQPGTEFLNLNPSQQKQYAIIADCSGMGSPGTQVLQDFLKFQGEGFLSNHKLVRAYDAKINLNNIKYKLGEDYNLGDYIWLWDSELGVDVRAQFSAYTKTVSASGEQINPVFGFDQVGISTILRRNGVI